MAVILFIGMIIRVIAANDAAHGFPKGCLKKALPRIIQQTSQFHDLMRHNAVGTRSATKFIGIARRVQFSLIIQCRLKGKFLSRPELIFPLFPYFHDDSGALMAYNYRIGVYILRRPLMLFPLCNQFIGGHTDTVTHHLDQHLVLFHLRKFKLFQS